MRVEEDGTAEAALAETLRERGRAAPRTPPAGSPGSRGGLAAQLLAPGRDRASRSRCTRSPTGGCVTNSAASPVSMNGLIV